MDLKQLQRWLEEEKLDCTLEEERLLVFFGTDHQARERVLEWRSMPLEAAGKALFQALQLRVWLPQQVQERCTAEVARLIAFINTGLAFPAFEFDEIQGKIGYRHVLLGGPAGPEQVAVKGLLGFVLMALDMYQESFAAVAEGKTTVNALFEQLAAGLQR